jgi:glutaminase
LNSSRVRTAVESQVLREAGRSIQVYQVQGHLNFTTTEVVVRDVIEHLAGIEHLVLDLKRVLSVNESACRLFYELLTKLAGLHKSVLFTHAQHLPLLRHYMKVKLAGQFEELFRVFGDNDLALEWCENRVLYAALATRADRKAAPADYELLDDFSAEELAAISALLKHRSYQRGQTIIAVGDEAREMFFLSCGSVSVMVDLPGGGSRRLATFSPGMAFGEMAFIDGAPRSARIVADSDVECHVLTLEDFKGLGASHPGLKIKLLENLCLNFCRNLRKANRELSVFD